MKCPSCGYPNLDTSIFCQECGCKLGVSDSVERQAKPLKKTSTGDRVSGSEPQRVPVVNPASLTDTPSAMVGGLTGSRLVAIMKDGSDGQAFPLCVPNTDIGRVAGELILREDPYLSDRHARVTIRRDHVVLQDLDSVNGIYVRLRRPHALKDRDMILIGQQVLRLEVVSDDKLPLGPARAHGVSVFGTPGAPRFARLVQCTTEGIGRDMYYIHRNETVLGREIGEIVFTDDPFLSRRHAMISFDQTTRAFELGDLESFNGTFLRIRSAWNLESGDMFRIGRHLFRYDIHSDSGNR